MSLWIIWLLVSLISETNIAYIRLRAPVSLLPLKKTKMSSAKIKHGPEVDTYRMAIQKLKLYYSVQFLIW
jgi:hypothetical protein